MHYTFNEIPMSAGAINERVDILTAPSNDTRRSNQGTVAANPTNIHHN